MSPTSPTPTTDHDPPIGETNAIELPPAESRAVIDAFLADLVRASARRRG